MNAPIQTGWVKTTGPQHFFVDLGALCGRVELSEVAEATYRDEPSGRTCASCRGSLALGRVTEIAPRLPRPFCSLSAERALRDTLAALRDAPTAAARFALLPQLEAAARAALGDRP